MTGIRKRHGREVKLKVVVSALRGDKTLPQLSSEHGVHPTQIKEWKDQGLGAMRDRFSQRRGRKKRDEVEEGPCLRRSGGSRWSWIF